MKIYSRKYFILGVIELGFFLFDLWLAWTERNAPVRTAWYDSIKWGAACCDVLPHRVQQKVCS